MLGYCRLTSLIQRKEPNHDPRAYYLHFYGIHCDGPDDEEHPEETGSGSSRRRTDCISDPAGNASIIIETR